MKVVTVVGARPQFIKAAVVSRAFKGHRHDVQELIIHTGQHFDSNMSDIFFNEMNIPAPNYNLGIGGGGHGQNTGRMLEGIERILKSEKPDWVLVYGDTDSTLAGALAAAKLHIPVAHVEAGLRSYNKNMPEEINRISTDHMSTMLFTPTDTATKNLAKEGITGGMVNQVGDVMHDAAIYYRKKAQQPVNMNIDGAFILCTIHRAENTDDQKRFSNIISAVNKVAQKTQVIFPVHPRTRKVLDTGNYNFQNITIVEPVSYLQMVWLLEHCETVITDSGGLQKEAYFFGKPCITARDQTEWVELVEVGANVLVGADKNKIVEAVEVMSKKTIDGQQMYGGGLAGERIVKEIKSI